jgi:hypothetical protein
VRGRSSTFQHGRGNVGERDVMPERGKKKAGMPRPGCHVQNLGPIRQRHVGKSVANVIDFLEYVTAPITLALSPELLLSRTLNIIELHRRIFRN